MAIDVSLDFDHASDIPFMYNNVIQCDALMQNVVATVYVAFQQETFFSQVFAMQNLIEILLHVDRRYIGKKTEVAEINADQRCVAVDQRTGGRQ